MCVDKLASVGGSMNLCFRKMPEILCQDEMEDALGYPNEDAYSVDWPWAKVNVLIENTRLA
jgi:hypothetical protein